MKLQKDSKTGQKVAIGAALAAVGGYLAGILTAPKSGKETRSDLADQAGNFKDNAEVQLAVTQRELAAVIKDAQSKTLALGAQAREEFNESLIRAKDAQNKTRIVLKAFKAGEADDPELNKAVKQARQAQKNLSKFLRS